MRVLIDTCVIMDDLFNREPFQENARIIANAVANCSIRGYLNTNAVANIYYLLHKHTHNDKLSREIINKLFKLYDIVDTTRTDCKMALLSQMSDYEDAILVETAKRLELELIVTRNIDDFKKSDVFAMTPEDFVMYLRENSYI